MSRATLEKLLCAVCVALFAVVLLPRLSSPLLWHDEGDTAMFATRILEVGYPKVHGPRNVLYEFGVARGLSKRVVPLCQRTFASALPSNIASDQLLQVYSPREKDWPRVAALRCAAQVALIDFSQELAEKAIAEARWSEGSRLPELPAEEGDDKSTSTPHTSG